MSSQREVLEASVPGEAFATAVPELDVDANELALVYRARGMSAEESEAHARQVLRGRADRTVVTGADTGAEVVGTGIRAAWSSFVFFCLGAAVPVLPFLFGVDGVRAVVAAAVFAGLALVVTGATVGVLSGVSPLRRATRQLVIGAAAAASTYLLGLIVGATIM